LSVLLMSTALAVAAATHAGAAPLVSACHISHDVSCGRGSAVAGMIAEGSMRHLAAQPTVSWMSSAFSNQALSIRTGIESAAAVRFSRSDGSTRGGVMLSLVDSGPAGDVELHQQRLQDPGGVPTGIRTVPDSVVLVCLASVLAGLGAATRRFRMTPPRQAAPWIIKREVSRSQTTDISSCFCHPSSYSTPLRI
jgi:hypothetical protein